MAEDDGRVLKEAEKLPLAERTTHSNWKARVAAFDHIIVECKRIYDENDPLLAEFGYVFPKAVADSNAAVADKALEALSAWLGKAPEQQAAKFCDKTCSNIVLKCFVARSSTVQRASDALIAFIELEQAPKVVEALCVGFSHKVPKAAVVAVETLIRAVSAFGVKVVPPQPILKAIPAVLDAKDAKIRDAIRQLVVTLSRWVGAPIIRTTILANARDVFKQEIEEEMRIAGEEARPTPQFLTRKEAARQAAAPPPVAVTDAPQGAAQPVAVEEVDMEVDPYDMAEPRDILAGLNKEFWENLEAKAWGSRKGSLTQLKEQASYPRLASGDYGDLNRMIKKIIAKDSNVAVVAEAISCCGALAQGLRKEYAGTARGLVSLLLEKFKDKSAAIGRASSESLAVMHKRCFTLLDVVEDLVEALGHANPKVREETCSWLSGDVKLATKPVLTKLAPALLPAAVKCAEDAVPSLREAAINFLVAFAVKFGNPAVLERHTAAMDEGRKKKLTDMVAEAMAAARGGEGAPAAGAAAAPAAGPVSTYVSASAARPASPRVGKTNALGVRTSVSSSLAPKAAAGGAKAGAAPSAAKKGAATPVGDGDDEASLSRGLLGKEDVLGHMREMFGEATVTALQNAQWKARLDAMDVVLQASGEGQLAAQCSVVVQAMALLPGWDEKNFQVMAKQFQVIRGMASAPTFSRADAFTALGGLLDKLSDIKLKGPAFDTLLCLSEAVGPIFMMSQLHKKAAPHKNPKVLAEAINWMAQALEEFGIGAVDVRALLAWMKEDLGNTNAGVRNAAIHLLGIMHRSLGSPLGDMLRSDVKPSLMSAIELEFEHNPHEQPPPAPSRVSRVVEGAKKAAAGKAGGTPSKGATSNGASQAPAVFDADDLLPRKDISADITADLLSRLANSNWKDRKGGLDDVERLVTSAGGRLVPQFGDLIPALKARLADTNKNLAIQALGVVGRLARATGGAWDRVGRALLAPALKNMADNKIMVRSAVTEMLDAWSVACPTSDVLFMEVREAVTHAKCSSDGRADGMNWMAATVAAGRCVELCEAVRAAASCSGDKAQEVRDASNKLMTQLCETFGATEVSQACRDLDPTLRKAAHEAVAKATGVAVAAVAAAAAVPSRPATAASSRPQSAAVRAAPASAGAAGPARSSTAKLSLQRAGSANRSVAAGSINDLAAALDGPLLLPDSKKDERAKKGRFKPAKLDVRPEEAATLEAEWSPLMGAALRAAAFHKDFKKHCEAADMLREAVGVAYDDVIAHLDLIFRWCVLRIVESNTQALVRVLEMLKVLFDAMVEHAYRLSEYEAKTLLPALVEKSGHNQDKIKAEHRELLRRAAEVYPPVKVLAFIKDGLESPNTKARVVCALAIGTMADTCGPVYRHNLPSATSKAVNSDGGGSAVLMALVKLVAERDTALRAAVLSTLEIVYAFEGAGIWRYLGRLSDQQKSLVEERLKYADKEMSRRGVRPGHRAIEFGADDGDMQPQASPEPRLRQSGSMQHAGGAGALSSSVQGGLGGAAAGGGAGGTPPVKLSLGTGLPRSAPDVAARDDVGGDRGALAASIDLASSQQFPSGGVGQPHHAPAPAPVAVSIAQSPLLSFDRSDDVSLRRDFDQCMQQLAVPVGGDVDVAVEAMKSLCYEMMDMPTSGDAGRRLMQVLMQNADGLLRLLTDRCAEVFSAAGRAIALGAQPNSRACKYALNTLMNIFQSPMLSKAPSLDVLTEVIAVLLSCLIDERLGQLPEGMAMLKALNLLMMKVLENCNRTHVFASMMQLLLQPRSLGNGDAATDAARWYDLVVKCMIKITKSLPASIDTIDLGSVLMSIHVFFTTLGVDEIRRRGAAEDKPLRMVKTILHEICKIKGTGIYAYARTIPGADLDPSQRPIIFPYIDLNIQTLMPEAARAAGIGAPVPASPAVSRPATAAAGPSATTPYGAAPPAPAAVQHAAPASAASHAAVSAASSAPRGPSRLVPSSDIYLQRTVDDQAIRNVMGGIIKRVSDKAATEQALIDLHCFLEANPHFDLDSMLAQASPTFRQFMTRGLARIRAQAGAPAPSAAAVGSAAAAHSHAAGSSGAANQPAHAAGGHVVGEAGPRVGGNGSSGGASWGSPTADTEMREAAALDQRVASLAAASASPDGQPSPTYSPGAAKHRVGADSLANLRDRMAQLNRDLESVPRPGESRSTGGGAGSHGAAAAPVAQPVAPAPLPVVAPPPVLPPAVVSGEASRPASAADGGGGGSVYGLSATMQEMRERLSRMKMEAGGGA